jgi:hypothetical protein
MDLPFVPCSMKPALLFATAGLPDCGASASTTAGLDDILVHVSGSRVPDDGRRINTFAAAVILLKGPLVHLSIRGSACEQEHPPRYGSTR